jgi:hypothetical protein
MRGSYAMKFGGAGTCTSGSKTCQASPCPASPGAEGQELTEKLRRLARGHLNGPQEDELEDEWPLNSSGAHARTSQKMPIVSGFWRGGAEGDRTPDLLIAKDELFGSCATPGEGGSGKLDPTTPAPRRSRPHPKLTGQFPCNSRAICTVDFWAIQLMPILPS